MQCTNTDTNLSDVPQLQADPGYALVIPPELVHSNKKKDISRLKLKPNKEAKKKSKVAKRNSEGKKTSGVHLRHPILLRDCG